MKRIYLVGLLLVVVQTILHGQDPKPELLKEPATWVFERFPLPPQFAPEIKYEGFEELRFAPGMFKKDSADYFSYAFVAAIDGLPEIGRDEVQSYIYYYYRGLCISVANEKKTTIDSTHIAVVLQPGSKQIPDGILYTATVDVLGVFADGAPVKLNMEIKVMKDTTRKKTYLFIITSPQERGTGIWDQLYKIRDQVKIG